MNLIVLAGPPASPVTSSLHGHPLAGSFTAAGLAALSIYALWLGVRNNDRIKIKNRDAAGIGGLIVGTLCMAAGGMWASVVNGIGTAPTTLISSGSSSTAVLGGGTLAVAITIFTFAHKWKKLIWPALGGVAAAVIYAAAGGIWGVAVNALRLLAAKLGG